MVRMQDARSHHRSRVHRVAFSLVELLVVISIMAIMAGLLLPVLGQVRDAAHSAKCASNLRQLGVVFNAYAGENRDTYPPLSNGDWRDGSSLNRFYVNLLADTGLVDVTTWKDRAYGSVIDGMWRCPTVPTSKTFWGGGYGILEEISHGSGYQIALRATAITRPSTSAMITDAENNQYGTSPTYTSWLSTSCPICRGGWNNFRRAAARHRHGLFSNVAFYDGHVAAVPWLDLLNNVDDVWRHNHP